MRTTVKMQSRGVLTMPKKVRNHFGWGDGDVIDLEVTDKGVLIKPIPRLDPELQKDLHSALQDFQTGNFVEFSSVKEFHTKRKQKWGRK